MTGRELDMVSLSVQVARDRVQRAIRRTGWFTFGVLGVIAMALTAFAVISSQEGLQNNLLAYVVVGFLAQLIDGALGMAYGVSSTTFLLSTGVSPAAASASVHTAEVFTTLASGISHLRLGNVDRRIFARLVIPGVLGGITGAYVLSNVPADTIKPLVTIYLLLMGVRIVVKALRESPKAREAIQHLFPLGLIGGFFDAIGGGGWGPIVTTTLVARGNDPRRTIGSVNTSEFFVTFAEALTFLLAFSFAEYRTVIAGLIIGGVLAAPLAALVCRKLSARKLMVIVGVLIIFLSLRTLLQTF